MLSQLEAENAAYRRRNAALVARVAELEGRLRQIQRLATGNE